MHNKLSIKKTAVYINSAAKKSFPRGEGSIKLIIYETGCSTTPVLIGIFLIKACGSDWVFHI